MPNLPQQQTIVQYIANASQLSYTFAFYAPLPTDIQVYYQASNAIPVPAADILALNSQYTVTYNADPTTGGFITLLFTPTTGFYLTINRQVAASLNTNFANAQNFNGANLDAALDRLLLLCQQNQNYNLQRNLSYVINTYLPNATPYTQLPPLAQNQFWVGSGSGVVAATISTVPSASVLQSMLANNAPSTDGARLVGYYDTVLNNPTTVDAFLTSLNTSAFRFIGFQRLTGSGTYTPTTGTKYCWARGIGGGAGGGGATSTLGTFGVGAGGSAGAYGEAWFAAASLSYSVGAAGTGGGAGSPGLNGGTTNLGSLLGLPGGLGGGATNTQSVNAFAVAQVGGSPVAGNIQLVGEPGIFGWCFPSGGLSGQGANSKLGAGGLPVAGANTANGLNGNGFGSGGSGGLTFGATNALGGNGTAGTIVVFEFG